MQSEAQLQIFTQEPMTKKTEVLFSTDKFDVVKKDDKIGIVPLTITVAVLPFTRDAKGLPGQLGVLKEFNYIRSAVSLTVITGKAEGEDPDILTAAQRKMLDRSGLDVQEPERWHFLGFMTTHKMINQEIPCFACDITGMSLPEPDEDVDPVDEVDDKEPEFVLMSVNQALDTTDCFIPTMFMLIFKFIFGFAAGGDIDDNTNTNTSSVVENPMQKKIMDIEGVIGAGKQDDEWMIHVNIGADKESIKSKVFTIVGDDATVNVEETQDANPKSE